MILWISSATLEARLDCLINPTKKLNYGEPPCQSVDLYEGFKIYSSPKMFALASQIASSRHMHWGGRVTFHLLPMDWSSSFLCVFS